MKLENAVKLHLKHHAISSFYRASEPDICYQFDGAEGGCFWSYNCLTDELKRHEFHIQQIFAADWKIRKAGSKIRFGFKSKNQGPLFMVWVEYWNMYEVCNGRVLFSSDKWIGI